mmetsp:Transcript_28707/g.69613  ORF Transcript_28707/g.69613 Transcript_28707/m.69613 type:complete len:180 (+) Transcript_28707:158-697(+)
MSLKCLKCPKQIRETILSLQRQEKYSQQMMAMTGKSRSSQAYPFGSLEPKNDSSKWGKRKVFFQCLWDRLHKTFPKTKKSMEKSDYDGTNTAFQNEAEKGKKNDDDQIDDGKRPAVGKDHSKNDEPVNSTDSGTIQKNTTNNDDQDKKQNKDEEERSNDQSSSGKRKRNDGDDDEAAVV